MWKTAFLVTFFGLLVQMAQAGELTLNQYQVFVCSDVLNEPVGQSISPSYVVPTPTAPITDPATGAEYSNLTPKETPKVDCQVNTQEGGYVSVTITGTAIMEGDVTGSTSKKAVPCKVDTQISAPYKIEKTPEGDLKCGETPSTDQVTVSCKSNPETSGGLLGLIQALLNILASLLKVVNNILTNLINSLLPSILATVKNTLNTSLKKLTDPIPMGNGLTCKYTVKDVKTDPEGYMNLKVEPTKYTKEGTSKPTPVGTYEAPEIKPEPDSACVFALHEKQINQALEDYTKIPFEVIDGDSLIALSKIIKPLCGIDVVLKILAFKPSGTPQVEITENRISGILIGMLNVYAAGSDLPFLEASGYLQFSGQVNFIGSCMTITLTFVSIGEVKFVRGQTSCDMSYQASQTFTAELKGKATIKECIAVSLLAHLPPKGPTVCTPKNQYVLIDQKKN